MVSGEPLPKELAKGPIRHSQELFFFFYRKCPLPASPLTYLVANFTLFPLRAQTHVSKNRLKKRPDWEHCLHTLLDVPCSP